MLSFIFYEIPAYKRVKTTHTKNNLEIKRQSAFQNTNSGNSKFYLNIENTTDIKLKPTNYIFF